MLDHDLAYPALALLPRDSSVSSSPGLLAAYLSTMRRISTGDELPRPTIVPPFLRPGFQKPYVLAAASTAVRLRGLPPDLRLGTRRRLSS